MKSADYIMYNKYTQVIMDITNKGNMISIKALLFTEYDVARNFYLLH